MRRELLCGRVCSGGAVGLRPLDRENPHLRSTAQAVCFARSATPLPFLVCRSLEVAYADRSPCCCREEDRSCLASASVGDGEFARARSWRRRACSCPTGTRLEGKVLVGIHGGRGKEGSPGGVSWSGGGRDCWAARRLGTRGRGGGGVLALSSCGSISIPEPEEGMG